MKSAGQFEMFDSENLTSLHNNQTDGLVESAIFGDFDQFNNISLTNATTTQQYPYEDRPSAYIMPAVFSLIFIIGVLGNGCLILIFFRHRAMRNVPNTYILSLAIADLLVIVTTVPFTAIIFSSPSYPWGEFICRTSEFFKDFSAGVSVFTLTALSGDRFLAIVDPLRKFNSHSGRRATRITIIVISSIWMLSILMSVPAFVASHIKSMGDENNKNITLFKICYPFPDEWGDSYPKIVVMARFLCYYAIPLTIIGIFYALIAKQLIYAASHVPGENMQGAQRQMKARRKVAVTVLTFVLLFGICLFPTHLFMLWFYFNPQSHEEYNDFWHVLRMVGFSLSFVNSCTNPVALYCVSGAFRKHFNRYLLCRKSSNSRHYTCDKSQMQREMTLTSQSTIVRRYTSKKYSNQSFRSSHGGGAETTVMLNINVEENDMTENEKISSI